MRTFRTPSPSPLLETKTMIYARRAGIEFEEDMPIPATTLIVRTTLKAKKRKKKNNLNGKIDKSKFQKKQMDVDNDNQLLNSLEDGEISNQQIDHQNVWDDYLTNQQKNIRVQLDEQQQKTQKKDEKRQKQFTSSQLYSPDSRRLNLISPHEELKSDNSTIQQDVLLTQLSQSTQQSFNSHNHLSLVNVLKYQTPPIAQISINQPESLSSMNNFSLNHGLTEPVRNQPMNVPPSILLPRKKWWNRNKKEREEMKQMEKQEDNKANMDFDENEKLKLNEDDNDNFKMYKDDNGSIYQENEVLQLTGIDSARTYILNSYAFMSIPNLVLPFFSTTLPNYFNITSCAVTTTGLIRIFLRSYNFAQSLKRAKIRNDQDEYNFLTTLVERPGMTNLAFLVEKEELKQESEDKKKENAEAQKEQFERNVKPNENMNEYQNEQFSSANYRASLISSAKLGALFIVSYCRASFRAMMFTQYDEKMKIQQEQQKKMKKGRKRKKRKKMKKNNMMDLQQKNINNNINEMYQQQQNGEKDEKQMTKDFTVSSNFNQYNYNKENEYIKDQINGPEQNTGYENNVNLSHHFSIGTPRQETHNFFQSQQSGQLPYASLSQYDVQLVSAKQMDKDNNDSNENSSNQDNINTQDQLLLINDSNFSHSDNDGIDPITPEKQRILQDSPGTPSSQNSKQIQSEETSNQIFSFIQMNNYSDKTQNNFKTIENSNNEKNQDPIFNSHPSKLNDLNTQMFQQQKDLRITPSFKSRSHRTVFDLSEGNNLDHQNVNSISNDSNGELHQTNILKTDRSAIKQPYSYSQSPSLFASYNQQSPSLTGPSMGYNNQSSAALFSRVLRSTRPPLPNSIYIPRLQPQISPSIASDQQSSIIRKSTPFPSHSPQNLNTSGLQDLNYTTNLEETLQHNQILAITKNNKEVHFTPMSKSNNMVFSGAPNNYFDRLIESMQNTNHRHQLSPFIKDFRSNSQISSAQQTPTSAMKRNALNISMSPSSQDVIQEVVNGSDHNMINSASILSSPHQIIPHTQQMVQTPQTSEIRNKVSLDILKSEDEDLEENYGIILHSSFNKETENEQQFLQLSDKSSLFFKDANQENDQQNNQQGITDIINEKENQQDINISQNCENIDTNIQMGNIQIDMNGKGSLQNMGETKRIRKVKIMGIQESYFSPSISLDTFIKKRIVTPQRPSSQTIDPQNSLHSSITPASTKTIKTVAVSYSGISSFTDQSNESFEDKFVVQPNQEFADAINFQQITSRQDLLDIDEQCEVDTNAEEESIKRRYIEDAVYYGIEEQYYELKDYLSKENYSFIFGYPPDPLIPLELANSISLLSLLILFY